METAAESGLSKRPTIRDVAHLAGVSHQTVSRFLREPGGLKAETRSRVEAAIRELHYRPNLVARSMRTRKNGRLAVLVPTLAFDPSRLLSGASAAAHDAGYVVDVLSFEGGARSRTDRLVDIVNSGQFEAVLSFAPILPAAQEQILPGTTIVVSGDFDDEMRGIGELADGSAIGGIIEHLAALGHRRFFHVAGDLQFASARARKRTYLQTLKEMGLTSVGVYDGDWSGESGMAAVASLAEAGRPSAIIAANDLVASGVIKGAHQRGWRVPADVSVTGWDDSQMGPFLIPSLSTVNNDLEQLGSNAMAKVIAFLAGETPELKTRSLNRIIWRDSVGEAPTISG
ncbi:LacI family transcriptional regulator [Paenarthrobacter nitroguajacolicus]|uniref:LacI family transcriptional regulator n=1 Tax=Paenarthrobacter nitroguajacolicus TaxID=211146 RepID=A0A558GNS3_PAENT|nr:LacI family DNA-binding transcriptional regulator [Paenarthrobacter nitroguajacolicus]TVU58496.1 LacI family transcriptional regulator [Paenarthrobacter nitroguajacolicus]